MDIGLNSVSHEARVYALFELGRRAGVSTELLQQWQIERSVAGDMLAVKPLPGAAGEIRFPVSGAMPQTAEVIRKTWWREPQRELRQLVPDFIVPFCASASTAGQPLFVEGKPQQFSCTEDLLASTALTLSRFEEIVSPQRDEHGRFPASASLAIRHGFLDRPIVDEYGLALQQVLNILVPAWKPIPRSLRVKITHDIDDVGIPFSLRRALGHIVRRYRPLPCLRDLVSLGTGVEPTYLTQVRDICQLSIERKLHSTLYWMASTPGPFDYGYDVGDFRIAQVMRWARDHGVEMGVHPGYDTFLAPALLEQQVQRLRQALQNDQVGGRQHYLRWCPETWKHWEQCGLLYDVSVGFADCVGFRAGTSVPYLPWLWKENRRADLLEIPLVVMDIALVGEGRLATEPGAVQPLVERLIRRCAAVGGVFTLLWHNNRLVPPYATHYSGILDALSGYPDYDWQADLAQLRRLAGAAHVN